MEIAVGIELDWKLEKKKLKRHRIEPKLEKTNGGDIELDWKLEKNEKRSCFVN